MRTDSEWLKIWASLVLPKQHIPIDWGAAGRMANLASGLLANDYSALASRLESSSRLLAPLEDPFAADFGLHRWLAGSREENYSDWLEYAIRQLAAPDLVYGLFKLDPPAGVKGNKPKILQREYPVDMGDPGRSGRLDLILQYDGACPLIIEVKVSSAEDAYTAKDSGYAESMGECLKVLLVTESESEVSAGDFRVRLWLDVAGQLRRAVTRLCRDGRTVVAAMLLAFAGAIEQNLCGLPPQPLSLLRRGVVINSERLFAYLDEVLQT